MMVALRGSSIERVPLIDATADLHTISDEELDLAEPSSADPASLRAEGSSADDRCVPRAGRVACATCARDSPCCSPLTALVAAAAGTTSKDSAAGSDAAATTAASTPAETTPTSPPPKRPPTTARPATASRSRPPRRSRPDVPKPTGKLDPAKTYTVVMKTSCGEIRIKLDQADNPKTANAFRSLVRANYYDGSSSTAS